MLELIRLLDVVFQVLTLLIVVRVILSWVPGLGSDHPAARVVYRLTSPIIDPIRRLMPPAGGLDLSPMIAVLLLWLVQRVLVEVLLTLL
jgi:YggT family protein